jgi:hypothetical protein
MRAPPPIVVTSSRFGCWRGALGALAVGAGAVTATWIVASAGQRPAALLLAVALLALVLLGAAMLGLRIRPFELRWDGARWWCACGAPRAAEPRSGEVQVALDLGSWLLLRFVDEAPAQRRRTSWLPLQRRGLEAHWHALRCAVHAPRPAPQAP